VFTLLLIGPTLVALAEDGTGTRPNRRARVDALRAALLDGR
jgi:hypothetical protein